MLFTRYRQVQEKYWHISGAWPGCVPASTGGIPGYEQNPSPHVLRFKVSKPKSDGSSVNSRTRGEHLFCSTVGASKLTSRDAENK